MYSKYNEIIGNNIISDKEKFNVQMTKIQSYFNKLQYISPHKNLLNKDDVESYFKTLLRENITNREVSYEFYDLFCGAGGLSVGFEKYGFSVKTAVEKDEAAVRTYHFNRPHLLHSQIYQDDITKLQEDIDLQYAPLVIGGPPCQGFSNANKQRKDNDERNTLYKFFVRKVASIKPEMFILENVPGILKYYSEISNDFKKVGYETKSYLLNTASFGFPQSRKRAFIVGFKSEHINLKLPLFDLFSSVISSYINKYNFVLTDAISILPSIGAKTKRNATYLETDRWGGTFMRMQEFNDPYSKLINSGVITGPILNHKSKFNNERDIEIYSLLSQGGNSDSPNIAHINPYANRAHIFKDKFYKLMEDRCCKTITAHMYYDCHMYIHPTQDRGLTPREAARIQGFPDNYLFLGTPNEWYRQIGNAVSPLLSNIIADASRQALTRIFNI